MNEAINSLSESNSADRDLIGPDVENLTERERETLTHNKEVVRGDSEPRHEDLGPDCHGSVINSNSPRTVQEIYTRVISMNNDLCDWDSSQLFHSSALTQQGFFSSWIHPEEGLHQGHYL